MKSVRSTESSTHGINDKCIQNLDGKRRKENYLDISDYIGNNTEADFKGIMSEDMKWSRLAQGSDHHRFFMNKEYSCFNYLNDCQLCSQLELVTVINISLLMSLM
jgi:hypothetical protein